MEKLTEKKRKWIIHNFRMGKSPSYIAKAQKISRNHVYRLAKKYEMEGVEAYKAKSAGRPPVQVHSAFKDKVREVRNQTGYGSEKIHFTLVQEGFAVSQRQIQKVLDETRPTKPCKKRRDRRKYVRYQWPISNWMRHTDWTPFEGKEYITYLDDRSRKVMAGGEFAQANQKNALFVLYQAILSNDVCPVIILSDKGTQFYNSKKNNKGERTLSKYEKTVERLGIDFWTSRRNHPQTNGKQEKFFDTMKKSLHRFDSFQNFIDWYNNKRIHHALNYQTPQQAYLANL